MSLAPLLESCNLPINNAYSYHSYAENQKEDL